MSKLVSMLQQKPTLIVSLPANSRELFQAAVEGGADAVKIHFNVEHRASGTRFGSVAEYEELLAEICGSFAGPVGAVAGDSPQKVTPDELTRLAEAGIDFVSLYAHHAPGWLLTDKRISRMMAVSGDYADSAISAYRSLPIDMLEASIVPGNEYGTPLNVRDLLHYRALVERCAKPVVVPSQRSLKAEELEALLLTGVRGVMIGAIVTGAEAQSVYDVTCRFRRELDHVTR
ncbi:hypothetical protein [Paenibacillus koleovorans]|uniref:hypothetical protein n=1 Tax=Paenibacillus koleovorans TaxID=121608 RepID=UPI000FDB8068|nr:hypothetical protein [Paenibacillus koleovorans]